VTEYATDREVRRAVFAMSGRLFLADLPEAITRELSVPGPVDDPQLDPTGERIAYVIEGALHFREIEGGGRVLASDGEPGVAWGLAEFAAAEEMNRRRGHWWSPDGSMLAAARVDERMVLTWYIADQTDPAPAATVRYPQAGRRRRRDAPPADVGRGAHRRRGTRASRTGRSTGARAAVVLVTSRDQRRHTCSRPTPRPARRRSRARPPILSGSTAVRRARAPPDGRVVEVAADRPADTNRIAIDGEPVTPGGVQVRGLDVSADGVVFRASQEPPRSTCGGRRTAAPSG
jgi:dipeptidyl-peptidase-4